MSHAYQRRGRRGRSLDGSVRGPRLTRGITRTANALPLMRKLGPSR
jgi:hypothetical protein